MAAKVEVLMSAKDAEMVAAWQRAKNNVAQFDAELSKINGTNNRLENSGRRVWEQTATPLEKYKRSVAESKELLDKKIISEETHSRNIERQRDLYSQAMGSSKGFLSGLSSGTMQVVAGLTGVGTVLGGILAVANQLRREYENMKSREKEASDRQMDVSTAQAAAYANLGTDPTMTREQVDQKAAEIAKNRGMSIRDVYNALSNAYSARGTESAAAATDAVDIAMLMNPGDAAGAEYTAGSILDLKKKGGGTSKQIAGQIIAAKQQARIVKTEDFAKHAVPAIFQLESFGNTQQESMAVYAAATQGIGDPTGEKTGSSIINFQRQLDELIGKRGPKIQGMVKQLEYIRSAEGKKTRDYLLGTDKKEGKLQAESKAFTTFRGFMTAGSTEAKLLDQSLQVVPQLGDQSQSSFESYQKDLESSPVQRNALLRRQFAAATENQQVQNVRGGLRSTSREGVMEYLKAAGASQTSLDFLGTRMAASDNLGGDVSSVAISALETRANNLRTPTPEMRVAGAFAEGASGDFTIPAYTPKEADLKQAAESQALADLLRESIDLQKQLADQQKKQAETQEKQLAAQQEANKQGPPTVNVQVSNQPGSTGRDNTPTKTRPAASLSAGGG